MIHRFPDNDRIPLRSGDDLRRVKDRALTVERIGRNRNYAYVCDSFHPEWRQDSKYKQYNRLLHRLFISGLPANERRVLSCMLEVRSFGLKCLNSTVDIPA